MVNIAHELSFKLFLSTIGCMVLGFFSKEVRSTVYYTINFISLSSPPITSNAFKLAEGKFRVAILI